MICKINWWPVSVCKFDLILATLSALTSVPSCPSLASLQWIAIAFQMSVFSVSFSLQYTMFFMLSVKPPFLCSIALLPFSVILTNPILFIFQINWNSLFFHIFKTFPRIAKKYLQRVKSSNLGAKSLKVRAVDAYCAPRSYETWIKTHKTLHGVRSFCNLLCKIPVTWHILLTSHRYSAVTAYSNSNQWYDETRIEKHIILESRSRVNFIWVEILP